LTVSARMAGPQVRAQRSTGTLPRSIRRRCPRHSERSLLPVPTTQSPEAPADESVARVVSGPPFDFGTLLADGSAEAAEGDGVESDGAAADGAEASDADADADAPTLPQVTPRPRASARAAAPRNVGASPRGGSPRSARTAPPRTFPRAERPAPVPAPEHHHLPGWVR